MFYLGFELQNPFAKEDWKSLYNEAWNVAKNKVFEVQTTRYSRVLIDVNLRVSARTDHSGFCITLGLVGYSVICHYYDTRHWDEEKGQWCVYD